MSTSLDSETLYCALNCQACAVRGRACLSFLALVRESTKLEGRATCTCCRCCHKERKDNSIVQFPGKGVEGPQQRVD